jgi:hypothetical protein
MLAAFRGGGAGPKVRGPVKPSCRLDVVFTPFFLIHRETVQPIHAGYGGLIIHANYTHSIIGMLALSAALGAMFLPRLGKESRTGHRAGQRVSLGA